MNKFPVLSFFLISSLSLLSCGEDETLVPSEKNSYAEGIIIYSVNRKIAEIFDGKTTDTLHASVDKNNLPMNVKYFDSNKNIIDPSDDKNISFGWEISNENILELFHDSRIARQYGFQFIGKAVGTTEIEFFLLENGSKIFSSGSIPVIIEN